MGKHVLFPIIPFIDCNLLDHLLYWFKNLGIVRDELTEEVDLPQEILHGFIVHWVGNPCDGPDLVWVYINPTFSDDVSHEFTFGRYKDTLLGIQGYPVFTTSLKNFLQTTQVV